MEDQTFDYSIEFVTYETPEQRAFREWWNSLPLLTQKMWVLHWANLPESFIYSFSGGR